MFKKIIFVAVLIAASSSFVSAQTETKTTTARTRTVKASAESGDAKAVRAVFDKLVKGIEDSDVEAVTSVYNNSPSTLYFNNNGTTTRGWEQDKANRESRYSKITNAKLDATSVRIEMLGTGGALLTCQWTQTQNFEGKPESASGRMTLVFKKIGKQWKIIHLHTSPDNVPATRPLFTSEREN
jgi:ketosteroid isomerase-like protein